MIPEFRESLLSAEENEKVNPEERTLHHLQQVFRQLVASDRMSASCRVLCEHFIDYEGKCININDQKDVFEFYTLCLDKLESQTL